MRRFALPILVFLMLAPAAFAEVVITKSLEPIDLEAFAAAVPKAEAPAPDGLFTKGGTPSLEIWLVPFEIDDTTPNASSTLVAIRNEGISLGMVELEFFDEEFDNFLASESFMIAPNQVVTRNLRANSGLVDSGGISRGVAQIQTSGAAISVDFFQLDVAGNFATGNLGLDETDFCTSWMARFIRFAGATEGSRVTFIVNGPLGSPGPETVAGNVYNEAGDFINSFAIETNEWLFEVHVPDLVVGSTAFGSITLSLATLNNPRGTLYVEHSAFGLYSLGTRAVCKDVI